MAFDVICDSCGTRARARSDFDKPRHPAGWYTALSSERMDLDVCSAQCAAAMNDGQAASGRSGLVWRYIDREDRRPATESKRLDGRTSEVKDP